jgi:hypothetical protein
MGKSTTAPHCHVAGQARNSVTWRKGVHKGLGRSVPSLRPLADDRYAICRCGCPGIGDVGDGVAARALADGLIELDAFGFDPRGRGVHVLDVEADVVDPSNRLIVPPGPQWEFQPFIASDCFFSASSKSEFNLERNHSLAFRFFCSSDSFVDWILSMARPFDLPFGRQDVFQDFPVTYVRAFRGIATHHACWCAFEDAEVVNTLCDGCFLNSDPASCVR